MKNLIKKQFPFLIKWYYLFQVMVQEKRIVPNRITLIHSNNFLYANPAETRGFALLRNKGAGQPYIKNFWRTAIRLFEPDIALDVGANYGEIFLDSHYAKSIQKIIGVEANPFLYDYLLKSKNEHPEKEKLVIVNGLASEENIQDVTFFIDKASSGRSTALPHNFVKESQEVTVSAHRLDDLIAQQGVDFKNIVFKIDVEGFEPFVLRGMTALFNSNVNLVGCIEFNLTSLERNKIDVKHYLEELNSRFKTILLRKKGELVSMDSLTVAGLRKHFDNKYTEGDILLFTNSDQLKEFQDKFNSN